MKFLPQQLQRSLNSQENGGFRVKLKISENSTHFTLYELSDFGWGYQKKLIAKYPKASWDWLEFEKLLNKIEKNSEYCHNQLISIHFFHITRIK